ncbi:MAG: DUF4097 family beta strand repeat-containing protein [Nocardioidaceae bacterium]
MIMEETMHTFQTPSPVQLRAQVWEGSLSVLAEDTDTTTVELVPERGSDGAQHLIDQATVEQRGDDIVVLMPKAKSGLFRRGHGVSVTVHMPTDSSARLESGSADIETRGPLGDLSVHAGSGDVGIELAADVEARLGSGDLRLETARGSVDIKGGSSDIVIGTIAEAANVLTGSGDLQISRISGLLKVKTGSGDVVVKQAGEAVDAMAGSGDLLLERVDFGRVKAKTGSGDVAIGVAQGTAAHLDIRTISGDVRSELDGTTGPGDGDQTVEISVTSGSGDVLLKRS